MSTSQEDADVVRGYLRTFAARDLDELCAVVADDVECYGAGQFVRGRHNVEAAVMTPGLTVVDQQVVELHSAGHRVTVAGTNTYRQDSTGKTAVQSFCKMYQVDGG
jgi:ketosteroid isomerase-like protein